MGTYTLKKGENLAVGYYLDVGSDPNYDNLVAQVHDPDGIIAELSYEDGDEDVVVHWPVDPEWERATKGSFADVMRVLEYGKYRLLSYQRSSAAS